MYDEAFENMRAEVMEYMREKSDSFLSQWCEEARVKSPVGYERDYSSKSFVVYTDRPGYLIGKGGALVEKYTQIMRKEFVSFERIKFVEITGGFANYNWQRKTSEWISVEEELPDISVPVLVTYLGYNDNRPHAEGVAVLLDGDQDWYWWDGAPEDSDQKVVVAITHWMRLPEPPNELKTE